MATPTTPSGSSTRRLAKYSHDIAEGELDAIAAHTRLSGVCAINLSYEYGCTTLARADGPDLAPILRRTLDWPFLGLGRAAIVAHRSGTAGDFFDVTWPGAVGTLTAVAAGRFAAAINQAPLLRRTRANLLRTVDYTRNFVQTLSRERGMPPLHLLRRVFETATGFSQALEMLKTVELARPVIFILVGCTANEIAVVERRERDGTVHLGPGSVANDWREPLSGWEPRPCALASGPSARQRGTMHCHRAGSRTLARAVRLGDPAGAQLEYAGCCRDEPRRGLAPGAGLRAVQYCGRGARNIDVYG